MNNYQGLHHIWMLFMLCSQAFNHALVGRGITVEARSTLIYWPFLSPEKILTVLDVRALHLLSGDFRYLHLCREQHQVLVYNSSSYLHYTTNEMCNFVNHSTIYFMFGLIRQCISHLLIFIGRLFVYLFIFTIIRQSTFAPNRGPFIKLIMVCLRLGHA